RVIAFSQYAQYCCNTTGSSINQIAKYFQQQKQQKPSFHLSFIDRWPTQPGLIQTFTELIRNEIKQFPVNSGSVAAADDEIILLFTAHSLPLNSVNIGDTYPMEVSATVMEVMKLLEFRYPFRLVWQSKVGPVPWQAPATDDVIKGYIRKGYRNILLIPISFINEHIETLHELDIEYCKELIGEIDFDKRIPLTIRRCPTPNDHPLFIDGIVRLIDEHLDSGIDISPQLLTKCPLCENKVCHNTRVWLQELQRKQC
ncbi:ferrochelatase, mitochondrial-like protein, partial [Euroglyphus maynei]